MRKVVFGLISLLFVAGSGCEDSGDGPATPDAAAPAPDPDASPATPPDASIGAGSDAGTGMETDAGADAAAEPPPDAQTADAAPAASINRHTDRYDPDGDRVLITHCVRQAVLAIDLESGNESILADQWPFTEQGSVCPTALAREADNESFHVVVERSYQDSFGDDCLAKELVTISAQGQVTPLRVLDLSCCDDCGGYERYQSPLLDHAHDRIVLLETDCGSDECDSNLTGIAPGTGERTHVLRIFKGGDVSPEPLGQDLLFDPRAPDSRVLALIKQDDTVDVIDMDSGAREVLATIQTNWDGLVIRPLLASLDAEQQRLFVVGRVTGGHAVIRIDIETGAQTLVYDGAANEQGDIVACQPQVALDTQRNRLLMYVSGSGSPGSGCADSLYAVDLASGTLARLPYTPVAGAAR